MFLTSLPNIDPWFPPLPLLPQKLWRTRALVGAVGGELQPVHSRHFTLLHSLLFCWFSVYSYFWPIHDFLSGISGFHLLLSILEIICKFYPFVCKGYLTPFMPKSNYSQETTYNKNWEGFIPCRRLTRKTQLWTSLKVISIWLYIISHCRKSFRKLKNSPLDHNYSSILFLRSKHSTSLKIWQILIQVS